MNITERLNGFFNKYTSQLHSGGPIENGELDWLANDYENTFKENIKKYPDYLQYYVNNPHGTTDIGPYSSCKRQLCW